MHNKIVYFGMCASQHCVDISPAPGTLSRARRPLASMRCRRRPAVHPLMEAWTDVPACVVYRPLDKQKTIK
jgi:hypothetical protein